MPKIIYVESTGVEHRVDAIAGQSVMEAAVKKGIPGIAAQCGGSCTCATCRVCVDEAWRDRIEPPQQIERDMLEFSDETTPGVRLSCQIRITADLDGLRVSIPEIQN